MGRYTTNSAYGHGISKIAEGMYRLHWTIDRYYANSRLRHPTRYTRDTESEGARRFAKKHGLKDPTEKDPTNGHHP